ncbi:WG repeat-containing protein [Salegentibacter chungangensis]|uniref:WG repeat-containing protein n=1 Tax=Salegentibacter chungangensis TaxID=1335724 RepID=A0ABW3NUF4_9FLAO
MRLQFITAMLILFPLLAFSQTLGELDYIAPMNDRYSAVHKEGQWGFINSSGELVVDFRKDLIHNKETEDQNEMGVEAQKYPLMQDNRSIIKKTIEDIPYYGFIDERGNIAIKPVFLNVSNFKNDKALALKIDEEYLGRNDVLDKKVVSYKYDVVLIDKDGKALQYLSGPFPVSLSKEKLRKAPSIKAKYISEDVIAVKGPEKTWEVFKI